MDVWFSALASKDGVTGRAAGLAAGMFITNPQRLAHVVHFVSMGMWQSTASLPRIQLSTCS